LAAHRRHRRFPRRPSPASGLIRIGTAAASAHPATTRAQASGLRARGIRPPRGRLPPPARGRHLAPNTSRPSVGGPLRDSLAPGLPPPTPPQLRHGGCVFRSPSPTAPDRSAVAAIPAVCVHPATTRARARGALGRTPQASPLSTAALSGIRPVSASSVCRQRASRDYAGGGLRPARSRQTLDAGPDAVTGARAPPRSTASRRAVADSLPPFGWGAAPRLFHPALPPALPHHRRLRPLALPVRNLPPNSARGVSPCGLARHRRITVRLWVPCATTRKVPVYGTISQVMQRWRSTPRSAW
jgi:hypothetical protein